ncbi:MAG: glycogen debranching protein GlgX [Acidimicrobiales bacterium]|nr:glycogen debranching protein GlgX [Acidimicrobiales bacterium]
MGILPPPLGAHWNGAGTTFAVHSEPADAIDVCLFDNHGRERRVPLERSGHTWWTSVEDVGPGTPYGFRARGPAPMDPAKLLVDPYARAIDGEVHWSAELFAPGVDSARLVPRSVVTAAVFDWEGDRRPHTPWEDTVVYELHVKGFTRLHPAVPEPWRGTYRGLGHPAVVDHLRGLGVTAVELLPVHHFVQDQRLVRQGLRNYWGYNTLGFFAPHAGYAASQVAGRQVAEFKQLVKALHAGGLEVWLDVVYNHTAEAGADGPLLSLRGLDEAAYYVVDHGRYLDDTGCGNTLNPASAASVRLVLDSLRHWVTEYHVDGFRFDLATVLGREAPGRGFDPGAALFDAIAADPVLAGVKMVAEPWDVGHHGYQVGRFPVGWAEWNGAFRDAQRDFWRGEGGMLPRFAASLTGSAELFRRPGRTPQASINFVTCHDGFTLADLVSYESKHNEANGEHNRDGTDDNRSWNCGVEGPSNDPAVRRLRSRQQRNLLAVTALASGVPMLCAGDEQGRTQAGNNNAYCQDNDVSWVDWEHVDVGLRSYVRWLLNFRREHAVLRSVRWPTGQPDARGVVDVGWYTPDGALMTPEDWLAGYARSVAVLFDGRAVDGRPADSVFVVCNAHDGRLLYRLPPTAWPALWRRVLDTSEPLPAERLRRYAPGERVRVEGHSMVILTGMSRSGSAAAND